MVEQSNAFQEDLYDRNIPIGELMQDADLSGIILQEIQAMRKEQKEDSSHIWEAIHENNNTVVEFLAKHPLECDLNHTRVLDAAKEYTRYQLSKLNITETEPEDEPKKQSLLVKGIHKVVGDYTTAIKWTIILMIVGAVMAYFHLSNKSMIENVAKDVHTIQMRSK